MASLNSIEYYASLEKGLEEISGLRAIAETAWNTGIDTENPIISVSEAYELAIKQPNIAVTYIPLNEGVRKRLNWTSSKQFGHFPPSS